jgi:SpoVK/Ycf46/Vps4 family AAA+-type ATPase
MSNKNPNNSNSNKRPRENELKHTFYKKPINIFNIDDSDDDYSDDNINEYDDDEIQEIIIEKEYVKIDKEINSLSDLIELGKLYESNKTYNIDLEILSKLVEPLSDLNNMIGMDSVKQDMVDHILFRIQKLDLENQDMMHTIIQGPPGVGKTEVAKIIGRVYLAMGILKNDKFIKARRSDLVAGYLGHTAKATQKMIDSANGGILFIDEVYSLGNREKRDSFAKECIDTINENLTEKKTDFICIIAGYKDEINECFFAYNAGLERRFPIRFTIEPYKPEEIFLIFKKKVVDNEWSLDDSIQLKFFEENYVNFKFYGGDMEVLFSKCKRAHSRRVFASEQNEKKKLNLTDLERGYELFKSHRSLKENENENENWKNLYL